MSGALQEYMLRLASGAAEQVVESQQDAIDSFITQRIQREGAVSSTNIILDIFSELGIRDLKPFIAGLEFLKRGINSLPISPAAMDLVNKKIDTLSELLSDDSKITRENCITLSNDLKLLYAFIQEKENLLLAGGLFRALIRSTTGVDLNYIKSIIFICIRIVALKCETFTENNNSILSESKNDEENMDPELEDGRYRKQITSDSNTYAIQPKGPSITLTNHNKDIYTTDEEYATHQLGACLRAVSSCRGQKAMLFLHSVGSGKTRTALCIASNYNSNELGINIVIITPAGLDTAFKEELNKEWAQADRYIKQIKKKFIYVTYLELYKDAQNFNNKDVNAVYKNAVIIADEAHRLIPMFRDEKVSTGISKIFDMSLKFIIMTGTPLQQDWSDFGILLNIVIKLNKKQEINALTDLSFRNEFYNPTLIEKGLKMTYAIVFRSIGEYWFNLGSLGLLTNPTWSAFILSQVTPLINIIGISNITLPISPMLLSGVFGSTAGAVIGQSAAVISQGATILSPIFGYLAVTAITLKAIDSTITAISGKTPSYPINIDKLIKRISPFIDFSDYKSLELEYINKLTTPDRRKKIQTDLKRYPVLNKIDFSIPYTEFQRPLYNICTSKGLVPSNLELVLSGRLNINDKDEVTPDSFISVENENLFNVLRCIGNATPDSLVYGTKRCPYSERMSPREKRFHEYWCYTYNTSRIDNKTLSPELMTYYNLTENIKQKFGCDKYHAVLDIIKHARMKFHHLPVIYSNFVKQGMETFSAYLTSLNILHIVIHVDQTVQERQDLIALAKAAYERHWYLLGNQDNKKERVLRELETAAVKHKIQSYLNIIISPNIQSQSVDPRAAFIDDIFSNKEKIKTNKIATTDTYVKSINNMPMCVIVHPDLLEGLDFVNNEVMLCLEPMVGLGNQEQVYGRISRSLAKVDGNYEWESLYAKDYANIEIETGIWDKIEGIEGREESKNEQTYEILKPIYEAFRRYFVNDHPVISESMSQYFDTYNTEYNRNDLKNNGTDTIIKVSDKKSYNNLQKHLNRFQKYIIQFKCSYYPSRKRFNDVSLVPSFFQEFRDPVKFKQWKDNWKNYPDFVSTLPTFFADLHLPFYRRITREDYTLIESFGSDGEVTSSNYIVSSIQQGIDLYKTTVFNWKVKEFYYVIDALSFKINAIIYRGKDAIKDPTFFMGAGHTSISYETPDLMFDARLQLQAEEYNTVRIKLSELTKQAIIESLTDNKVIYDINQYYRNSEEFKTAGCEKGREYYPINFPDNQDCIVTRKKSRRDTRRCSLIGPIAITTARRREQTHGVLSASSSASNPLVNSSAAGIGASSSTSNPLGSESEAYNPAHNHLEFLRRQSILHSAQHVGLAGDDSNLENRRLQARQGYGLRMRNPLVSSSAAGTGLPLPTTTPPIIPYRTYDRATPTLRRHYNNINPTHEELNLLKSRRSSNGPFFPTHNELEFLRQQRILQSAQAVGLGSVQPGQRDGLRRRPKHEGGGNIPLEEFVAPDNITEEDIYDINKLIAPYKDVSTVEELIDLAEERLKEHAPGLRRRKGKLENNLLQLENAKHNLAVLKQKPTKLHHEGGYKKKTMYKRTKFIRKTRRKLRNN